MKEILLMLLIAVYLGFGYWAIQYIKVNIMGNGINLTKSGRNFMIVWKGLL